jgi:hypothetical protein
MATPIGSYDSNAATVVPSSSSAPVSCQPASSSATLADTLSSQQLETSGGLCQWIGSLIDSLVDAIKSFFSFSWLNSSDTGLNQRIQEGTQIIENHFNDPSFQMVDRNRSAVVSILKYNDQVLECFGRLEHESLDDFKLGAIGRLRELLTSNRAIEDGSLFIQTILVKKNSPTNFAHSYLRTLIRFPTYFNPRTMTELSPNISDMELAALLTRAIPENRLDLRRTIFEFLTQSL